MVKNSVTQSRIFREEGKSYWTGEIKHFHSEGKANVEVYTGSRKSDVGDILARRRREIRINDRIKRSPLLTLEALSKICAPLSDIAFISEEYESLSKFVSPIPVSLVTENDILFTANSMLMSGYNISKTRQFISFFYSCIKRYKAVTGFGDIPTRNFGVYSRENNAVCAVYFKTNERNRIMKEALRLYGDMKPYYCLGSSIMFMMYTGLDVCSLAGLKFESLDGGKLVVKESLVSFKGDFSSLSGAIKHPFESEIPLTTSAKELIEPVFASLPRYEEMKSSDGARQFKRSIGVTFDAILKNTMLYREYASYGLSVLRNTFAVNCIRNGVDIKELSLMLGHPNEEFTKIVYLPYIKQNKLNPETGL